MGLLKFLYLPAKLLNRFYNKLWFTMNRVKYADFPKINGKLYLRNKGEIHFGKCLKFNSSKSDNAIGGGTRMVIKGYPNAILKIGDHTGISNSAIVCMEKIVIGKYVKIGGSVKIYDTDFHSLDYKQRKDKNTDMPINKEIYIGDYSFIGAHSIILKGVKIGERCIIGAGSVVTKSIPDGEIWGGNPAKFIRKT